MNISKEVTYIRQKSVQQELLLFFVLSVLFVFSRMLHASPAIGGYSGLISMPDARIAEDGTLRFGLSRYDPYSTFWSSLSMFPRLELGARYTSIDNTRSFPGSDYGTYKDKAFDSKFMLLQESRYLPALSVGTLDFLGTKVFDAEYLVLSKKFGPVDITFGYGNNRIEGVFGGISYQPKWAKQFEFVYEYDAIDYKEDFLALESGAIDRKRGSTLAINYKWGWLGVQLAYQGGDYGLNGYVSIPLMQKEFVPKIDEPAPFKREIKKHTVSQWQSDASHRAALAVALEAQGYKNVQILLTNHDLNIGFSTRNITLVGRAVGRAVRTTLLMGPSDISNINITYFTLSDMALVTYNFHDLPLLIRFFEGKVTYGELLEGVTVSYADPSMSKVLSRSLLDTPEQIQPVRKKVMEWIPNEEGHAISLRQDDEALSRFRLVPFNLGIYFNDVGGAFRYDTFALAKYDRHLKRGLFFNSSVRLTLLEDVSQVEDESNSLLPHVRSDIANYKRDTRFKLNSLLLNKYTQLRPRIYCRLTIGYYEEMFGGFGGQLLYLPKQSSFALDLTVDRLRKRDTDGGFGFREYTTTTALAALHYQLPSYGVTFTLRGGRFLAQDRGVRYEIQRRFRSGVRIGAWYTVTDKKDITSPGSPDDPYRDKGIFMSIPLGSMLTKDTRSTAKMAISPWTRDVGQMVKSPGDLYEMIEEPLMLDWENYHLLSGFHQ